jgi:hypothetical protein
MPAAANVWLSGELAGLRARADHSTSAKRPMVFCPLRSACTGVAAHKTSGASSPVPSSYASPSHALGGMLPVCDGDSGLAGRRGWLFHLCGGKESACRSPASSDSRLEAGVNRRENRRRR